MGCGWLCQRPGNREESVPQEVASITLPLPYRMGSVNCYLLEAEDSYLLIDTGGANARSDLERELVDAGCERDTLRLIVLTHGDFDHTGNAAYLRERFSTEIAMHADDLGMAERGDMFWNRSSGSPLVRLLAPILFKFSRANRFTPDITLEEGDSLSQYGLDAQVLSIPGHSRGTIGILTAGGELFCGDLLENTSKPAPNTIMDDATAADASIGRLGDLQIITIYPGHGRPFPRTSLESIEYLSDRQGAGM
jgi:glyoxylase-like metal-dependent hydrolase (beta-lactamase superfamily II)